MILFLHQKDNCDLSQEISITAITIPGGDEPKSLKEALRHHLNGKNGMGRHSQSEMDQLHKMGTWVLVKRPADAIPISNIWVFIKKLTSMASS